MTDLAWVFGYGSLIWKQDFPYVRAETAYIEGYSRRLWQGSHDHRGTPTDPGRVLTLIEAPGERCFGRALLVEREVFEHLDHREKNGYERHEVAIHQAAGSVAGITYLGSPANPAFLGDAPLDAIVAQIKGSVGESGSNVDYVLELHRALAELEIEDPHLATIAARLV